MGMLNRDKLKKWEYANNPFSWLHNHWMIMGSLGVVGGCFLALPSYGMAQNAILVYVVKLFKAHFYDKIRIWERLGIFILYM